MKNIVKILPFILFVALPITCSSRQRVNPDESVIIVERKRNDMAIALGMDVFLNNQKITSLRVGETFRYIIKNGEHEIRTSGAGSFSDSNTLKFSANSQEITFLIGYEGFSLAITKTGVADIK